MSWTPVGNHGGDHLSRELEVPYPLLQVLPRGMAGLALSPSTALFSSNQFVRLDDEAGLSAFGAEEDPPRLPSFLFSAPQGPCLTKGPTQVPEPYSPMKQFLTKQILRRLERIDDGRVEISEPRYEPLPHPEDVKRWLEVSYKQGLRDGFLVALEKLQKETL